MLLQKDASYIIKTSLLFCVLSAAFSFIGLFVAGKGPIPNPSGGLNLHEIGGHILWGLVAGSVFLGARYIIITGLFAVLIDSDHLIALLHFDGIIRLSHSITFGAIAVVALMLLFGRRDYKLGAAAFAGVLAHISFDIFSGNDAEFPIFAPFYNRQITFPTIDWIYFEISAVVVAGIVSILVRKMKTSPSR